MSVHSEKLRSFIQKMIPTVNDETIKMLSSKSWKSKFQKGELFVKEGEVCRHLLFIHQGLFRYYILHEGQDITKDFAVDLQNPFCTAYTSLMLQKPSEIWIEALEPCEVLSWDSSDVLSLFQDNPVWLCFAKMMGKGGNIKDIPFDISNDYMTENKIFLAFKKQKKFTH